MDNLEIIKRKAVQIFSVEDLEEKIKSGKKLKIFKNLFPKTILN